MGCEAPAKSPVQYFWLYRDTRGLWYNITSIHNTYRDALESMILGSHGFDSVVCFDGDNLWYIKHEDKGVEFEPIEPYTEFLYDGEVYRTYELDRLLSLGDAD